jgi:acyl-CoA reductase-like NAD-dependent aldehyde dehydrogenase
MAGNVGLLKHASNVPATALLMQELSARAGFPEGVFQTLLVSSGRVEAILRDERAAAATLTGSAPAGRSVAAIAGSEIKKVVLELERGDVGKLVADAVAKGARALCGGAAPDRPGFCYPPTVLAGITPDMRVRQEEVFGPVATVYRVADIEAAIKLANGTQFGLGANAWTNDEAERSRLIRDLAAGMVFINGNVTSYPQLPFGGVKNSGHGRELPVQGIREFCNVKTVWIGGSGAGSAAVGQEAPRKAAQESTE